MSQVRSVWTLLLVVSLALFAVPLLSPPDVPWLASGSFWRWDWAVLVPLIAALSLPTAIHHLFRRRRRTSSVIELRLSEPSRAASYRLSRRLELLVLDRPGLRRQAEAYMDRLCLALVLIAPAALALLGGGFISNQDLTTPAIRSPVEHLVLSTLLLLVVLFHRPTLRRLVGAPLSARERSLTGIVEG